MLERICGYLKNWFELSRDADTYSISDGSLVLDNVREGQYFRIVGSIFNDGIYTYPAAGLTDETFEGEVWPMAVPNAVLTLCKEIEAWTEKNGDSGSPMLSESFGGYSYTRSADSVGSTWETAFRRRLSEWRKL